MIATLTLAVAVSFGGLAAPGSGYVRPERVRGAQESKAPGALAQDNGSSGAKKKKVIRLDALTVEGRIQKPQAFYILQRSNLNFEELNRTESFIPKVEKSVEYDPF